jgi:hypothetical protein
MLTYALTGIRSLLVRYNVFTRPHVVSSGAPYFSSGSNTSTNTFCGGFSETTVCIISNDLRDSHKPALYFIHSNCMDIKVAQAADGTNGKKANNKLTSTLLRS